MRRSRRSIEPWPYSMTNALLWWHRLIEIRSRDPTAPKVLHFPGRISVRRLPRESADEWPPGPEATMLLSQNERINRSGAPLQGAVPWQSHHVTGTWWDQEVPLLNPDAIQPTRST